MRRVVRVVLSLAGVYLVVAVAFGAATIGGVQVARLLDGDRRADLVPGVENFRFVDEKVWAGGQPDALGYRRLARRGVTTVVDLRTGASDDELEDDESLLRRLGIAYHRLPVPDGRPPTVAQVVRMRSIVRGSTGIVLVHCGAGVGRTLAMEAGYVALEGRDPRTVSYLAVGPITLAQLWFVADAEKGEVEPVPGVVRRMSELLDAPRRGLSRLRAWL